MNSITSPLDVISEIFSSTAGSEKQFADAVDSHFSALDRSAIPLITPGMDLKTIPDKSLVRIRGMVQDLPNPELYIGVAKLPGGKLLTSKFSDGLNPAIAFSAQETTLWDRKPCVLIPTPSTLTPSQPDEALIYLYEPFKGQPPTLHDTIEVIGVLSQPPAHQPPAHQPHTCCDSHCHDVAMEVDQAHDKGAAHIEEDEDDEAYAHAKAFGSLPRVHAILYGKSSSANVSPDFEASSALGSLDLNLSPREVAIRALANTLGGDELAAEYLLLLSLERITSRASDLPLGIAPMNLTGCPLIQGTDGVQGTISSFAMALHLALSSLLPITKVLPISVQSCNTGDVSLSPPTQSATKEKEFISWAPKRLSNNPRVTRSPLQVPKGTLLILDETVLTEGKLDERGLTNLQTLAKMIQGQSLEFEFEAYKHSVPMEVCPLVLSNGRSILKDALSLQLPLRATREIGSAQAEIDERSLSSAKSYLNHIAHMSYELTDAIRKELVDEFVMTRQKDPSFSAESFQAQLTLARACALSFGESELSMERWSYLKEMERVRAERIRVV